MSEFTFAIFIWCGLLITFALTDLLFSNLKELFRRSGDHAGRQSDMELQLATFGYFVTVPLIGLISSFSYPVPVTVVAAALAVGGLMVRMIAMRQLRGRYALTPKSQPDRTKLVKNGVYGVVRHPGYAGMCLFFVGAALVLGGPWALLTIPVLVVLVLRRIAIEEAILREEFGQGYDAYRSEVPGRLVPAIGGRRHA